MPNLNTKLAAYNNDLLQNSPLILSLVDFYPATARKLIENHGLSQLGSYLLKQIPLLGQRLRIKEKLELWAKLEPDLMHYIILWEKQPFQIFKLLSAIEKNRTSGRSVHAQQSQNPWNKQALAYPHLVKIITSLIQDATDSEKNLKKWQIWLSGYQSHNQRLNSKTLAACGVTKTRSGLYRKKSTVWQKTAQSKKYSRQPIFPYISKLKIVRQEMHKMESYIKYANRTANLINYLQYQINNINTRPVLSKKTIKELKTELTRQASLYGLAYAKTKAKALEKLHNLIASLDKLSPAGYKKVLQNILTLLIQRQHEYEREFQAAHKLRDLLALDLLHLVYSQLNKNELDPEIIHDQILVLESILSGYENTLTWLNTAPKKLTTAIHELLPYLEDLAAKIKKQDALNYQIEKLKAANKNIFKNNLEPLLNSYKKINPLNIWVKNLGTAIKTKKKNQIYANLRKILKISNYQLTFPPNIIIKPEHLKILSSFARMLLKGMNFYDELLLKRKYHQKTYFIIVENLKQRISSAATILIKSVTPE